MDELGSWCLSCVVWTWIQMIVDKSWQLINEWCNSGNAWIQSFVNRDPADRLFSGDSSAGSDILIPRLRHSEFLQLFHGVKSIPSLVTHSRIIQMSYRDCIPLHSHCNTCVQKYWLSHTIQLLVYIKKLFCHFPTDWQKVYTQLLQYFY